MSNFFKYFPTTKYRDAIVKNITRRVKILDEVQNDPFSFLPYTVMDDDSPEMVAYYYYGAAEYSWVVFLSKEGAKIRTKSRLRAFMMLVFLKIMI